MIRPEDFAEALNIIRVQEGLGKGELLEAAGVNIKSIRAGRPDGMSLETLSKLLTALDCPLDKYAEVVDRVARRNRRYDCNRTTSTLETEQPGTVEETEAQSSPRVPAPVG